MTELHPARRTAVTGLFILGFGIFSVSFSPVLAQVCYTAALLLAAYILAQFPFIPLPRFVVLCAVSLSALAGLSMLHTTFPDQATVATATFLRMQLIGLCAVMFLQVTRSWQGFMTGSVAGGVLAAVIQLINVRSSVVDVGRSAAGVIDLNEYGTMAVLLVAFTLFAPFQLGRWGGVIRFGAVLILSLSLLSTASRTAGLLLAFVLVLHFVHSSWRAATGDRKALGSAAVLPVVALCGVAVALFGGTQVQLTVMRLMSVGEALATGGNKRLDIQSTASTVILDSPILGHGLGASAKLIEESGQFGTGMSTHNSFLEITIGLGILGLLVVIALMASGLSGLIKVRSQESYILLLTSFLLVASSFTLGLQTRPHYWTILYLAVAYPRILAAQPAIIAAVRRPARLQEGRL